MAHQESGITSQYKIYFGYLKHRYAIIVHQQFSRSYRQTEKHKYPTRIALLFRTKDLHRVAIKIINKKQTKTAHTSSAAIMNEVNILRKVKHPCIINLEDVIDTKAGRYLIVYSKKNFTNI